MFHKDPTDGVKYNVSQGSPQMESSIMFHKDPTDGVKYNVSQGSHRWSQV